MVMDKPHDTKKIEDLTKLLIRIGQGKNPKMLRQEATRLISGVTDGDIEKAEQNLIKNGYSQQLVEQLSAAFVLMAILDGQAQNLKKSLPENHLLRKVLVEHDLLRCFLADLKDTVDKILELQTISDTNVEFMKLTHIVEHLSAMTEHIDREEDVIFPSLKKHGWSALCRSAKNEHVYIKVAVSDLITLISSFKNGKIKEFKNKLSAITKHLAPVMTEHLFQEDNILYPIAIEVINDEKIWTRMKEVCDEIGYCGVHI
jgi:DUF438 domain-containing protein